MLLTINTKDIFIIEKKEKDREFESRFASEFAFSTKSRCPLVSIHRTHQKCSFCVPMISRTVSQKILIETQYGNIDMKAIGSHRRHIAIDCIS